MYTYLLIQDGNDWEDMAIILTEEDAINASRRNPFARVEIFGRDEHGKFTPTYSYYKNGLLVRGPGL
jgi:hypothetical protein